jgi:hypothetical protein
MAYILNIGLARDGKENLSGNTVRDALREAGIPVQGAATFNSDTEPTIVVEIDASQVLHHQLAGAVWSLAKALEQECIGVYGTHIGKGALIGPRADKWGEFNPEYFLLLDGSRLAQPALKLAA